MTTTIKKAIERKTSADFQGEEIVVRITQAGLELKLAKERWSSAVTAPWGAIYSMASKLGVRLEQDEKRTIRKVKRGLLSVR